MAVPVVVYAGAFVAGQLGGIALGTAIAKKVLPSQPKTGYYTGPKPYDLHAELNRLGFKY